MRPQRVPHADRSAVARGGTGGAGGREGKSRWVGTPVSILKEAVEWGEEEEQSDNAALLKAKNAACRRCLPNSRRIDGSSGRLARCVVLRSSFRGLLDAVVISGNYHVVRGTSQCRAHEAVRARGHGCLTADPSIARFSQYRGTGGNVDRGDRQRDAARPGAASHIWDDCVDLLGDYRVYLGA